MSDDRIDRNSDTPLERAYAELREAFQRESQRAEDEFTIRCAVEDEVEALKKEITRLNQTVLNRAADNRELIGALENLCGRVETMEHRTRRLNPDEYAVSDMHLQSVWEGAHKARRLVPRTCSCTHYPDAPEPTCEVHGHQWGEPEGLPGGRGVSNQADTSGQTQTGIPPTVVNGEGKSE